MHLKNYFKIFTHKIYKYRVYIIHNYLYNINIYIVIFIYAFYTHKCIKTVLSFRVIIFHKAQIYMTNIKLFN